MTAVPPPLPEPSWSDDPGITDLIIAIESVTETCQSFATEWASFEDHFYETCNWMLICSLGWAAPVVSTCIAAYEGVVHVLVPMLDQVHGFLAGLRAPTKLMALGDYLLQSPATTMAELRDAFAKPSLAASQSWRGDGASAYFTVAKSHEDAMRAAQSVVFAVGAGVRDFGTAALASAVKVLGALIGALLGLITGLAALTPPVTPAGAITSGISITTIGVMLNTYLNAVADDANAANAAVKTLVADLSPWPSGGGGDAATREAMGDGSVKDDISAGTVPEWSRHS